MNRELYFKDKDANIGVSENVENNTLDSNFSKEKSVLFLFVFIIIAIIGIVYVKDKFLSNYFKNSNPLSVSTEQGGGYLETYDPIRNSNEDSDGDGATNWREVVNGTDPDVKDAIGSLDADLEVSSSSNFTTLVSRDLYAISKYKEKYEDLNTGSLSVAVRDNYADLLKPEKQFILNTAKEDTLELIKRHGNIVASMFLGISLETDININKEVGIPAIVENILTFKENLNKVCSFSKEVKEIPRVFSEKYRTFMYNCDHMINILDAISKIETDEVKTLIALNAFDEVKKNIDSNFSEYKDYFLNNGKIKFESDEYGYVYKISN
jgi:hypothetical protein